MSALVANQLLTNDYEFNACALEDECFISSELRKVGNNWTFPILLWLTKLSLLRQVQISTLKHKIIRELKEHVNIIFKNKQSSQCVQAVLFVNVLS